MKAKTTAELQAKYGKRTTHAVLQASRRGGVHQDRRTKNPRTQRDQRKDWA
jgi:hypothetical protein